MLPAEASSAGTCHRLRKGAYRGQALHGQRNGKGPGTGAQRLGLSPLGPAGPDCPGEYQLIRPVAQLGFAGYTGRVFEQKEQ